MRGYLRKRIFIFILLICIGFISVGSITYAIFTKSVAQENPNTITTLTCLDMSFKNQENIITLENQYPMSDEEALMDLTPYKFTIKNNCKNTVLANINFETLITNDSFSKEYINIWFNNKVNTFISNLDKLPVATEVANEGATSNNLASVEFNQYEEKEFEFMLWANEDLTLEQGKNKNFSGKLAVTYQPIISEKIYGVKRDVDTSSSAWTRTDDAVGLVANAQFGTTPVRNDFDNIYPWSDIISYNYNTSTKTETAEYGDANFKFDGSNGEVLTRIPEFYYRRYQQTESDGKTYEYVQISAAPQDGFTKSETFSVGRYTMSGSSSAVHSRSGVQPLTNVTIDNFRTYAQNLGNDFGQLDYRYYILQLLYLVEYADYNSQAKLGLGYTGINNSVTTASGGCNDLGMKSGTYGANDGNFSVIYRGIEDIYGNVWQFVDGININDYITYICYDPSRYDSINFLTNECYKPVGYTNLNVTGVFTSKVGYDVTNPLVAMPIETKTEASSLTYITDHYITNSGNRIAIVGGEKGYGESCGLWFWVTQDTSASKWTYTSARLLRYN